MPDLFETTRINGMELANRFMQSATDMGIAGEDGSCSPRLLEATRKVAEGEVGLMITGFAYATKGGQVGAGQLGCHDDELLPSLKEMTGAVHQAGAKIALQMEHGGIFSAIGNPDLTGLPALGPSPMPTEQGPIGQEASKEEIQGIVEAFGAAAARAQESGFDAVQIHAAHGFLLNQFLSPFFNKRTDVYGGSLKNRARALMEVYSCVRATVGQDYPVLVKINSEDLLEGGFSRKDMLEVCSRLEQAGIDAIELSGGTVLGIILENAEISFAPSKKKDTYWRDAASELKRRVKVPIILVGGVRSVEEAEKLVGEEIADYLSLCRPLIREPDLIKRWRTGDRRKADCISDNRCLAAGMAGEGVHCVYID